MDKKLYIIGDPADKDNILVFCSQLTDKGMEADVIFLAENGDDSEEACNVPVALLWISSKAGSQLFNVAQERNKRNLTTLNLFAEPVSLKDSERSAVGRNRSVFMDLHPNEYVDEVTALYVNSQKLPNEPSIQSLTQKPISQVKLGNISNPLEGQSSINLSSEQESNKTEEDIRSSKDKKALWMPWVWYVCSIVYYVLNNTGIVNAWSDQPILWSLITLVFFVLAYKILRSTITAIKISKWCYTYIPFSIFMILYDLIHGFRLIEFYFEC